jgi:hypothetical protein
MRAGRAGGLAIGWRAGTASGVLFRQPAETLGRLQAGGPDPAGRVRATRSPGCGRGPARRRDALGIALLALAAALWSGTASRCLHYANVLSDTRMVAGQAPWCPPLVQMTSGSIGHLLCWERHERDGTWWAWVSWIQGSGARPVYKIVAVTRRLARARRGPRGLRRRPPPRPPR